MKVKPNLPFIDWMKCLGITLIVIGHVSKYTDRLIPPIYPKQLGVAFFLFATGCSLARQTRPSREVVFKRLFEVYLFGIAFALLMSAITYSQIGDLAESNYLPFLLGSNVAFDNFPANPTTWFIGTYIHIVLLWALLLRGLRIGPQVLIAVVVVEILLRAILTEAAGLMVAYMVLPNWAAVFLLGLSCGQGEKEGREEASPVGLARYLIGLGLLIVTWPALVNPWVAERSFPFMRLAAGPRLISPVLTSATVTLAYVTYTWLTYQVTNRLRPSAVARFIARNTLIIFIAHMPVFYALRGPLAQWTNNYGLKVGIQFTACLPVLALVSELINRAVRPKHLRDRIWKLIRNGPIPTKAGRSTSSRGGVLARAEAIPMLDDRVAMTEDELGPNHA